MARKAAATKKAKDSTAQAKKRGPKSGFTKQQLEFLTKWLPAFHASKDDRKSFWVDVLRAFLKRFPDCKDPDASDDDDDEDSEERKPQTPLNERLRNWFNNTAAANNRRAGKDPFAEFLVNCMSQLGSAPRRLSPVQYFMGHDDFRSQIKATTDEEWPKYKEERELPDNHYISYYNEVAKRVFDEQSEEVRKRMAAEAAAEHEADMARYTAMKEAQAEFDDSEASHEMILLRRAKLASVMTPVLRNLYAATGLNFVLLGGAPPESWNAPEKRNKHTLVCISEGATVNGLDFAHHKPEVFERGVMKHFMDFLDDTARTTSSESPDHPKAPDLDTESLERMPVDPDVVSPPEPQSPTSGLVFEERLAQLGLGEVLEDEIKNMTPRSQRRRVKSLERVSQYERDRESNIAKNRSELERQLEDSGLTEKDGDAGNKGPKAKKVKRGGRKPAKRNSPSPPTSHQPTHRATVSPAAPTDEDEQRAHLETTSRVEATNSKDDGQTTPTTPITPTTNDVVDANEAGNPSSGSVGAAPRKAGAADREATPLPDDMPEWAKTCIKQVTRDDFGSIWQDLVTAWVRSEWRAGWNEGGVGTANRPTEITNWIRGGRGKTPVKIKNVTKFQSSVEEWWMYLQESHPNLTAEQCRGRNGIFLLLMALLWWRERENGGTPGWLLLVTEFTSQLNGAGAGGSKSNIESPSKKRKSDATAPASKSKRHATESVVAAPASKSKRRRRA